MIDIVVTDLSEECIKGRIGHAEVLIARNQMPSDITEYRSGEGVYIFTDQTNNEELKIDRDSRLRCKCFEVKTSLSNYWVK